MNDFNKEKFYKKQQNLSDAYERSEKLIEWYTELLPKWPHSWDFNLLYDLQDRIINRIHENRNAYYRWHWETYGFNVYP